MYIRTTFYIIKFKLIFHKPLRPYIRQHHILFYSSVHYITSIQIVPS